MSTTNIDRATGLASSAAIKAPCLVATTANITLAGLQTINGVAVTADKRVLVKDQTDSKQNGIYVAATSDWQRAPDFDNNSDILSGTRVWVVSGTVGGSQSWVLSTLDPITLGTSNVVFIAEATISPTSDYGTALHASPEKITPADADEFGIWNSVTMVLGKVTWANIKVALYAALGPVIAAFTEKTTLIDADNLVISDSAASNVSKRVTLLNLWNNALKAKADALYQPLKAILTTLGNLSNAAGVLTNNGSGALSWAAAATGMTLLGTITTTSGTTQALTGVAGSSYKYLKLIYKGVSASASFGLTLALSSTNGAAYGAAIATGAGVANNNSTTVWGSIDIFNCADTNTLKAYNGSLSSVGGGAIGGSILANTGAVINAIRIGTDAGTLDAGSVEVYGVN